MSFPTVLEVARRLFLRLKYMNRHSAYYEATAKNLEKSAEAVVVASDDIIEKSRRGQIKNRMQRERIARATDTLTKLLEQTKYHNAHPQGKVE